MSLEIVDQTGRIGAVFRDISGQRVGQVRWSDREWSTARWQRGVCALPDGSAAFITDYCEGLSGDPDEAETLAIEPPGDVRWRLSDCVSLGVVGGERLFCQRTWPHATGDATALAAVSTTSGDVLWERTIEPTIRSENPFSQAMLTGDVLWLKWYEPRGADTDVLAALSAQTGRELWRQRSSYVSGLVAANGTIYAVAFEGEYPRLRHSVVALEHAP